MTTVTIKGHIHAVPAKSYQKAHHAGQIFNFWEWEEMSGEVYVCPYEITFEIPEGWDPVPAQLDMLKEKRAEIVAKNVEALAQIDKAMAELQAITYQPA